MAKWGLKDQTRVVESFDKPVSNPYKMFLINKNADIRGTGVTPGEKIVKSATLRTKRGEDPVMALFAEMVTYGYVSPEPYDWPRDIALVSGS
jgi:hypothetical protein